jgi:hypothetical protein
MFMSTYNIQEGVPAGSGEFKPDKPSEKDGGRWNKTFGYDDKGTIDEAGTSQASAVGDVRLLTASRKVPCGIPQPFS